MMIFNINFHNSNSNAQVCVHIILKLEKTNVTTQYSKLHSICFCTSIFTYNCPKKVEIEQSKLFSS